MLTEAAQNLLSRLADAVLCGGLDVYWIEPGGEAAYKPAARELIASGLLVSGSDDLFEGEAQTWRLK